MIEAVPYVMMLWVTLVPGQPPASARHDFSNQFACESFARWFIKDQHLRGAYAICVPKEGHDI